MSGPGAGAGGASGGSGGRGRGSGRGNDSGSGKPGGVYGNRGGDPWRPWHARESLDRLLAGFSAPRTDVLEAIFGRWPEIVGADLAEHCRPAKVQGDLLTVVATDPAWASELRWLESEVIARVREVSGSERISRLRVRTDSA